MTFASWLRGLVGGSSLGRVGNPSYKKSRLSPARTRDNRYRPSVEPLEDRLCPSYATLDLGTLGGTSSFASAVNASGQVAGGSYTAAGDQHAFLWQNGNMTDLGTLGGSFSAAADINTGGQIVGGSRTTAGSTVNHAYVWTPTIANGTSGSMTDLGTLGGASSVAQAINNHGAIVGASYTAGGAYHPFVWENGVMYDLDTLLPANSGWATEFYGLDINDNGQIAGTGLFNGVQRAFLISDNDGIFANGGLTITNLGTLGGGSSQGSGINSSGQVVGWSNVATGNPHAFRYSAGVMTDLKTLIGNPTIGANASYANAINDTGQIVGTSIYDPSAFPNPSYHAVLWQNGKINDLNKQLPRGSSWVLEDAIDINATGQIVGQGSIGGQRHAFLMVPGAALQAESVATEAVTKTIGTDQVQSLLGEAIARWQAAGANTSSLGSIDVRIADLDGTTLGFTSGNTIWIDSNAAGWGWFVDATPNDDSEFTTPGNQGEQNRMDLLSVIMHEMGHVLGYDHHADADSLMHETLVAGLRKLPTGPNSHSDGAALTMPNDLFFALLSLEGRARKNRL
jgi:probable HAF family extracellular repeat protein